MEGNGNVLLVNGALCLCTLQLLRIVLEANSSVWLVELCGFDAELELLESPSPVTTPCCSSSVRHLIDGPKNAQHWRENSR